MQPFYTIIFLFKWMSETFQNMRTSRVIPTETKGFFSPDVSRKSMCMLWKDFFTNRLNWRLPNVKCLIFHVLSSSYYVTRFELGYEWKAAEQRRFCVSNNILLYKVSVNHEWMDANNIVSKCWFMRFFPTHEYSRIISHISSKYMPQVSTKNW